jgi:hypothetical protein
MSKHFEEFYQAIPMPPQLDKVIDHSRTIFSINPFNETLLPTVDEDPLSIITKTQVVEGDISELVKPDSSVQSLAPEV